MLEAPVSGGVTGAEAATIVIMVGGDEAVFEAQRPLLASFSKEVVHVGEVGMGSVAKLINNQLAFSNMAAAAEALAIGAMSGIDLGKLNQVIENASGFSCSPATSRPISRSTSRTRICGWRWNSRTSSACRG
jgi:3-hydroxyisobutyrate dehydrogenase-like beta-hydroxyacid dehydrogenase